MNKTTLFVPFLFVVACASDPNKEVKGAETEVTQSEVDSANKHDETTIKNREAQAAADREKKENRTDSNADGQKNSLDARANLADAKIKLAKEREAYSIDATARFNKAEAKAKEAKVKGAKLTGKKAADFKTAWGKYSTYRDDADGRIKKLHGSSDDAWTSDKDGTESVLSSMEKAASDVASTP